MATEEILLKYRADITDLQSKIVAIEAQLKKTSKTFVDTGNVFDRGFSKIGEGLKNLVSGFVAGFAIERVMAFGKASFEAFAQAELQAKKLQVAVGVNGGLQADFQNLIDQSDELQDKSIFSDDDIQKAQTMALQFGLTAKQVEDLIPIVADFASATGQSLQGALEAVLRGTEGAARGLKLYGIEVDKTATKAEILDSITGQLTDKFAGQAEVVGKTAFGATEKLKNKIDDFKESVGGFIVDVGEATSSLILWVANGFKPLDEELDNTTSALTGTREEISRIQRAIDNATVAGLITQLQQLEQADGPADAIANLNKQIKEIKLRQFKDDLDALKDNQLEKTLKDLEEQAKKTNFQLSVPTDLKTDEKIKALKEEIASRKIINKLVDDQNAIDPNAAKKAADDARKAAEEQIKAREALRQFTLKSLDDNAKAEAAAAKEAATNRITDEKELAKEIDRIDLELLEKEKQNRIDTAEDTTDIEIAIAEKRTQIRLNEIKEDKEAGKQLLADIEQNAKDQIAILDKVKDDPTTKINEEEEAQKKILSIRKITVNQTILALDFLKEAGILNEEEYTKAVERLAQERKLIKADEDAFRLQSDKETAKQLIDNILAIASKSLEFAGVINDINNAQSQSKIDSLQAEQDAQEERFDREQDAIQEQVDKRLITEAQGENKSAELKKQRAESEKKSNDAVNAIKNKQAQANKVLAIFNATLNLAEAISVALSSAPPPFNATLAAISAALAGAQLAAIIATPVPKFFKGEEWVKRGLNPAGRDTIPAMLNEGERVVTTEKNIKHWDIYQALDENRFDKYVMKHYVVPKLKEQQKMHEQSKESSFAENIAKSIQTKGIDFYDLYYLWRKGMQVTNVDEIVTRMAEKMAIENDRAAIRGR